MANYAPRVTAGLELIYNKAGHGANPVPYILKPNTAFAKGRPVVVPNIGSAALCNEIVPADHTTTLATHTVVGVMAETVAAADNPALGITYGLVYDNPLNVYKVTLAPGQNNNAPVVGSNTDTTNIESTTALAGDHNRGAIIAFYEGPLKGVWRTISAVTNADNQYTVVATLPASPTAADLFYVTGTSDSNTQYATCNVGMVGASVDSTGLKVSCATAIARRTGILTIVGFNAVDMTFDVMLRGMLCGQTGIYV